MFLSQYVSLLPLLRCPSIVLFIMEIVYIGNLYFSFLIWCPKYAIFILLTVFNSYLSILIRLRTSWFVMWEVLGTFKIRRYIHISNASIFFSPALLRVQISSDFRCQTYFFVCVSLYLKNAFLAVSTRRFISLVAFHWSFIKPSRYLKFFYSFDYFIFNLKKVF